VKRSKKKYEHRNQKRQVLHGGDALTVLQSILNPLAEKIEEVSRQADVVFVVHRPTAETRVALKKRGLDGASVYGMSAYDAARFAEWDALTRKWLAALPEEDQVKIFLISGDGTALLTLTLRGGMVMVNKEPDIYPVETQVSTPRPTIPPSATGLSVVHIEVASGKTRAVWDGAHGHAVGEHLWSPTEQPLVVLSNEHGVIVGRRLLREVAAGSRPQQAVDIAAGAFEELLRLHGDAIRAEPVEIILP
jgi:hypothetical protein